MVGVRRIGRNAGVALRRLQSLLRDGGIVVAVDQVVRHPGMLGIGDEQGIEQRRRLGGRAKVLSLRSWLALITSAERILASTSSG